MLQGRRLGIACSRILLTCDGGKLRSSLGHPISVFQPSSKREVRWMMGSRVDSLLLDSGA
jgi:hypothetical protein